MKAPTALQTNAYLVLNRPIQKQYWECEMKQLLLVAGGLLEKKDLAAALGDFE